MEELMMMEIEYRLGTSQDLDAICTLIKEAVDEMAKSAMEVQRLLKNNPREVTEQDAKDIYNCLY